MPNSFSVYKILNPNSRGYTRALQNTFSFAQEKKICNLHPSAMTNRWKLISDLNDKRSFRWANKLTAAQKRSWNGHAKLTTSFSTDRSHGRTAGFSVLCAPAGWPRCVWHRSMCSAVPFVCCFFRPTAQFTFLARFCISLQRQASLEFVLLTACFRLNF